MLRPMTQRAPRVSAGLLLFRRTDARLEVMLAHMGGPYWQRKDARAWSLPKGECGHGEDPLAAARREFAEETGLQAPDGEPLDLGTLRQPSGKLVHAWALEGDLDVRDIHSNTFELEWPKGSGAMRSFPEVDRAAWFDLETASGKLVKGQVPFLHTLATRLQTLT